MIKIKTIAIGNNEEAFIEDNFKNGINIIYSNKNNRGKSILMQSIMYAIGNEPVFPTKPKAFYYKNYYFYLDIEINDEQYYFLRKDNTICILYEDNLILKESIDAFSDFFDKNIEKLPFFKKNKKDEICRASIELFYLSFFLGSDRKSTSDLPSSVIKRFNKRDFENMLCGMKVDMKSLEEAYKKIEEKKGILSELKQDMKVIDKKRKKIREFKKIESTYIPNCTRSEFDEYKKIIEKISIGINEKQKEKKRIQNKIFKKEGVISQIKSIERSVEVGFLFCEECKSRNIRYSLSKRGASFDITNAKTRIKILDNLRNDIAQLNEKLKALDETIGIEQANLNKYMAKNNNISANDFLFFSDDIKENVKYNEEYLEIIKKIDKLKEEIDKINNLLNVKEKEIKTIKNDLENKLRDEYFKVDNKIEGELDGLFTKIHESFSGSQALFFLYARIMTIIKYFDLKWPVIIDSIRDGEVDTLKEDILLKQFKSIKNQVILSATLKDSEYKEEKYIKMDNVNPIDYSDIPENTLLRPQYVENFKKLVEKFNIKI